MRYVLATALLAAIVCAGCEKAKGPQTTDPNLPAAAPGPLKPLEPPAARAAPDLPPPAARKPIVNITPEPAPAAPKAAEAPEAPESYVIQKDDTLWKIAARLYGNGQRWRDIAAANPGVDVTKLPVGKDLVIPRP